MSPQDALTAIFATLSAVGSKPPTNALIFSAARSIGVHFTDTEGKAALKAARVRAPGPPLDLSTNAPGPPKSAPATRASAPEIRNSNTLSLPPTLNTPNGVTKAVSKAKRPPTETDIAAWRFLDATLKAIVAQHGPLATTQATWKQRNKRPALDMLAAGITAEEAVERLQFAFTDPGASQYFGKIDTLYGLQKHWLRLEPAEEIPESDPLRREITTTTADLVAAGLAKPVLVATDRPDWFKPEMAQV